MQTLRGNATGEDGGFASTLFVGRLRGRGKGKEKVYRDLHLQGVKTPGAVVEEKKRARREEREEEQKRL